METMTIASKMFNFIKLIKSKASVLLTRFTLDTHEVQKLDPVNIEEF